MYIVARVYLVNELSPEPLKYVLFDFSWFFFETK